MKKILLLLIIVTAIGCKHKEKKAPCGFEKHKSENISIKEDLTK